jgi:phosphatidylserine/phosphatidylglycerophosphate/cardiolipin synthase-like enzyme
MSEKQSFSEHTPKSSILDDSKNFQSKKIILLFILIILINGCASLNITGKTTEDIIIKETTEETVVYFCPKDDCSKILTDFISSAKNSVHCALFDVDLKDVIHIIAKKSSKIDVKLVVDNNNYGEITGPGVKQDNNNQLTHNKFCLIDGEKIFTGSFNPTERGAYKNNNNLLILYSKYLAENYEDEFQELWNGDEVKHPIIYLNNKKIENYFCPEDNCKEHVIENLNSAEKSIYFMTFSFTDEEVADAILFKDNNIEIKGVFEKMQAGSKYSQYKRLKEFGLDVKLDKNKYNMHHKVFIIDNETVITGSYNPSGSGNYRNDENIIIIHDKDIAKKYLEEFEDVFN